jgi:acetyltransferase-like isoleucine patch superfamily enzyme
MLTAHVDPAAVLGAGCQLGHGAVIGAGAVLGERVVVGHAAIIHPATRIGSDVRIDDHAVLGKPPRAAAISILKVRQALPPLTLGDECFVGAQAVLYLGARLAPRVFVADLASIREEVVIETGVIVGRNVTIENNCRIGEFTKLESNAYIVAGTIIEERCFIAPMVCMANDNFLGRTEERFKHMGGPRIRRGARVGANAVLFPGVEVGSEAVVGAGAVVTADVPPEQTVVGVPARVLRPTPPEQLLRNCLPEEWARLLAKDAALEAPGA